MSRDIKPAGGHGSAPLRLRFVREAFAQPSAEPALPLSNPLIPGSFISILLGMAAKNTLDFLGNQRPQLSARAFASRLLPPLLVSPMVFLGFVKGASVGVQDSMGMVVLFCFAFQNGFFWQDVLGRPRAA